jgi:branched-chain amino acid transport system substrate-binding protein
MAVRTRCLRRLATLVVVAAFAFSVAPVRAADPFEIDAIVPVTGVAAFAGKEQALTINALEDYVNRTGGIRGRPVKFVIHDNESSPQVAVQLVSAAIARHASSILGPAFAGDCGATMSLVKNGPVAYCLSPGVHPPPGSFMFSSGVSTVDLIKIMLLNMRERGLKRIALITSTDASGQDGEKSIDEALAEPANKDMSIVAREHFATTDISVAAQIARINAANPQVLVVWTTGSGFGTVLRNWHETGSNIPVLTTPGNQTYSQMNAYASFLPRDLEIVSAPFAAPDVITDRTMKTAVQALYDSLARLKARPGFPAQTPWDPGVLLVSAYRKLGTDATAEQIRQYLANLKGWVGEGGRYDFTAVPQRGVDGSTTVMVRWDASKNNWVAASKLGGAPL